MWLFYYLIQGYFNYRFASPISDLEIKKGKLMKWRKWKMHVITFCDQLFKRYKKLNICLEVFDN